MSQVAAVYSRIAAGAAVAIGALALLGWLLGITALTTVLPGAVTMKPNTGLCILLLGIALRLIIAEQSTDTDGGGAQRIWYTRAASGCAALVGLITALTLLQYLSGVDLGIDTLVYTVADAGTAPHPSRMAQITALGLLLLAAGFLTRRFGTSDAIRWAEWCVLAAGFAAFVAILCYAYGVDSLYAVQIYSSIALHTAAALVLLASGFLCSSPRLTVLRRFGGTDAGSILLRRLLPAAVILPPLIGWLRLSGQQHGWYSTEFGLALFATANVMVFVSLVWLTARALARTDLRRQSAQEKLQAQLARTSLLGQITGAIAHRQALASIYEVAVRSVTEKLPADLCTILTLDPGRREFTVIDVGDARAGPATALHRGEHLAVDEPSLARCLRGELVCEAHAATAQTRLLSRLAECGLLSVVIAPLRSESNVFGALITARRASAAFTEMDCEFLVQLGEQVGLAAHQAQLNEALQAAYDDLRQSQAALMQQERLRALAEMSSGVAHDINNAITPVSLYAQLLTQHEQGLSERARDCLSIIARASRSVADTVARMRDFSRPSVAAAALDVVDLNAIVREVVELTQPVWKDQAQGRGVQIRLQLDLTTEPMKVQGSGQEVRDALTNLLLNATDAIVTRGDITLRTRRCSGLAWVEVADTGLGMDEQTRRRCLEPFYTTKGERGTGLGLAMVYGMAQRHGAKLEIHSEPGVGTTMCLGFGAVVDAHASSAATPAERIGRRLQVLTIDDDPLVCEALRSILVAEGHVVEAVDGGAAGIRAFHAAAERGTPFDVVITDLGMPDVDGRRVAAAVKTASTRTPIIMLTGWGQRMLADAAQPAHVDRMLGKPPTALEIRAALFEMTSGG